MKLEEKNLLENLPSVDLILKSIQGRDWISKFPRRIVVAAVRNILTLKRNSLRQGFQTQLDTPKLYDEIGQEINRLSSFSLQRVINATGIVIHTNLGRSCLCETAVRNIAAVSNSYSNLEYDIEAGKRGKRHSHVKKILTDITGAEDALIVNNNAAAVLLCLSTIAKGKEVIVSRGELVEIGGSFRIPDVMSASGAVLVEVGTTNKTHLYDYRNAINENTGLILKVHKSNYKIAGFSSEIGFDDLVALGKEYDVPVMHDLGSGSFLDLRPYGIHTEPTVQEIVRSGIDLVTFSGDKLLGGPQGGVIVGKKKFIDNIQKNPLARALRIDKFTIAAFEATLMEYMDIENALNNIPSLRMLFQKPDVIHERAAIIASSIRGQSAEADVEVIEDNSRAGGGSLPEVDFPTYAVSIKCRTMNINAFERQLRRCSPPIIGRIKEESLLLDARTIEDRDIPHIVTSVLASLGIAGNSPGEK